jgi:sortase A
MNPLFADEPAGTHSPGTEGYLLSRKKGALNPAADLIRSKIDALYAHEPNARKEAAEAVQAPAPRSTHQQFMYQLSTSGKSLADIQTDWHNYYVALSDDDKRQVWQEFYATNARTPSSYTRYVQQQAITTEQHPPHKDTETPHHAKATVGIAYEPTTVPVSGTRNLASIKKRVLKKVRSQQKAQLKAKHHLQSLMFGLGVGGITIVIFLFSFFNEMVIAPFIQPGSHASATPIILDNNGIAPSSLPEVIVPKINLQLPVIYGSQSINEADVQSALEDGIFHYPTTSLPGQQGNAAYFGHSSNNIFNKGKYKFAFALLHELEPGDIFYLTQDSKLYTYKVFDKRVVEPTDTWVLNPVEGKTATATLITCDPPGTSAHRLIVWGEQVSPSPTGDAPAPAPATPATNVTNTELPGNAPSLWSRVWHWATPW